VGTDGTASQQPMGALPPSGQWFKLAVPASSVGLEGATLSGMNFILYDGGATWDYSGKSAREIRPVHFVFGCSPTFHPHNRANCFRLQRSRSAVED